MSAAARPANPADPDLSPVRAPIRDAATLVIVDDSISPSRIIVGRRSAAHVFMAGKLVFPGGRVDRSDLQLAAHYALAPATQARLCTGVAQRFRANRATALALAAIRETFEETGIMIGRRSDRFAATLPIWCEFAAEKIEPDPAALVPFARAVTPPGRVRRFDTRFFAVRATAIGREVPFHERPTDEFDLVRWITLPEMLAEDLAPITRQVLGDLAARLEGGLLMDRDASIPFYRRVGSSFRTEWI